MAEKDITEKILLAYNDVFADIVNVLLFNGEEIIHPDELLDQAPRSAYKADGKIREIERDVAKRWSKQNIRIACVGIENQTASDPDMPLRVIAYDGAEYRAQLDGKDRYPVITLVLYFGHKKHWDDATNLLGVVNVPEKFRPYVNDYKINLFEIAYLSEEQVKLFKSDFGVVADYFVQMQKDGDYKPDPVEMDHVQEVLQLLSVMTGDNRFEEAYSGSGEGGPKSMCEVLDRICNESKAKGIAIGIEKGIEKGKIEQAKETALNLRNMGLKDADIAKALNVSQSLIQEWFGMINA